MTIGWASPVHYTRSCFDVAEIIANVLKLKPTLVTRQVIHADHGLSGYISQSSFQDPLHKET